MTPMLAILFASLVEMGQRLRRDFGDECEVSVSADTVADTCDDFNGPQA